MRIPRAASSSVMLTALLAMVMAACAEPRVPPYPIPTPSGAACSAVLSPPKLEASHITPPQPGRYNTDPPTSGIHYDPPAQAGIYTEPVADELQVHNLEHGHVAVQWRDLSAEELAEVTAAVEADPVMMLLAPRPSMPWKLALTSWGKIQVCTAVPPGVDAVIQSFVATNRNHAPESVE